MTYSQEIKAQLCNVKAGCNGCKKAFIYALLLLSHSSFEDNIAVNSESHAVAKLLAQGIVDLTGVIVTTRSSDLRERNKRPIYTISVDNREDTQKVLQFFFKDNSYNKESIDESYLENSCCVWAFLRGAYCSCGTMIDPAKEYHLEFAVHSEELCDEIIYLLCEFDLEFRKTQRGKNYIAYIKESQQIEDVLTSLGAIKASMGLMNLKMEKELRNRINRRTNCETANIDKTVNASVTQIEMIMKLKENGMFDSLTAQLKEAARLRLDNPDMSLSELCAQSNNKISRSGLNHRLNKICEIGRNAN